MMGSDESRRLWMREKYGAGKRTSRRQNLSNSTQLPNRHVIWFYLRRNYASCELSLLEAAKSVGASTRERASQGQAS